jgi:hypothetical protein
MVLIGIVHKHRIHVKSVPYVPQQGTEMSASLFDMFANFTATVNIMRVVNFPPIEAYRHKLDVDLLHGDKLTAFIYVEDNPESM